LIEKAEAGDSGDILLSVVVIARNEENHIEDCITSLLAALSSRDFSWEIILVDSASTDGTIEKAFHYPITIVQEKRASSPSAGRFIGTSYSNGKYILFIDGDSTLDRNWLDEAVPVLEEMDDVAGVAGLRTHVYHGQDDGTETGSGGDVMDYQVGAVNTLGGPAAFRGRILRELGSYNPFLWGEEEAELCYRIRHAGYKLIRLPVQMTYHKLTAPTRRQTLKRGTRFIVGYGQTLRRNLGHELFRQHASRLRMGVFSAIWAALSLVSLVLGLIMFLVFNLPYLLYGTVIAEMAIMVFFILRKKSMPGGVVSGVGWFLKGLAVVRGFIMGLKDHEDYPLDVEVLKG